MLPPTPSSTATTGIESFPPQQLDTFAFQGVSFTLKGRELLSAVHGQARSGQLMASASSAAGRLVTARSHGTVGRR